jgi:phosphoribosylglycinamide formyltransferase-1
MFGKQVRLAVLISGSGRTLKNFIELAAAGQLPVEIRLVVSSSGDAGGLRHAEAAGIPTFVCNRCDYAAGAAGNEPYSDAIFSACRQAEVDYVAMAGFLKYVPVPDDFEQRVVNIHPSLIPSFCGKGMYGHRVHQAVLDHGAKVTGCTVHFADNEYDCGPIILQRTVPVLDDDTADTLADRVFAVECEAYPQALRALAAGHVSVEGRRVRVEGR